MTFALSGVLIALSAFAWVLVLRPAPMVMPAMGPSALDGMMFTAQWGIMMVAMMLPSALPMILLYRTVNRRLAASEQLVPVAIFTMVYLAIWLLTGVPVYMARVAVQSAAAASPRITSLLPYGVVISLALAGVYQLSGLKQVCLKHCEAPLTYLMRRWRSGYAATINIAARHAAYCVGCCWALMVVLVVAGSMSVPWVITIAAAIFLEKVLPGGQRTARMVGVVLLLIAAVKLFALIATPLNAQTPPRTILAIGAHAGDAELTMGQLLVHQQKAGDRIVILHMTAGEGGNPKLSPALYGEQKKREGAEAARIMGAEVIWAPYRDGEIPDDEAVRLYVADVIRQVKPTHVITHWRSSIHKDHARTSAIVNDAVLLASLEGVKTAHPAHRGVRGVYYAENWEDPEGFQPYLFIDVSDARDTWLQAVRSYEFVSGTISSFRYQDYYDALAVVRGAVARKTRAVAFDIDSFGKKRIVEGLQ